VLVVLREWRGGHPRRVRRVPVDFVSYLIIEKGKGMRRRKGWVSRSEEKLFDSVHSEIHYLGKQ
jgi:hypothetical protein